MRPALVCLMLVLSCMQVAAAAPAPSADPIVPILTLSIQPPILKLLREENSSAVGMFNGTASVNKMPGVRCVVTLTSSIDVGWVTQISPSTMVFTSESPQSYTVAVSVPPGTPSMQGNLVVNGRAVAYGLQSTAVVKAIIDVTGPAILNLTGANRTQANATRAAGAPGGGLSGTLTVSALVAVLIAVPAVAYLVYRRRRQRAYPVEAA
jgi:hypothetical protein